MQIVELYIRKGVKNVEAAAYMEMTGSLVYFYVSGIKSDADVVYRNHHRILVKIFRPDVAEAFPSPAPERLLKRLLDQGRIAPEQAAVARQ